MVPTGLYDMVRRVGTYMPQCKKAKQKPEVTIDAQKVSKKAFQWTTKQCQ